VKANSVNPFIFLKHSKATLQLLLAALLLILLIPHRASAQDTGYISGTVTDKSGAAIAGANVTVTEVGGNQTHNTTSNGDGAYTVAGLPGGTYNLSVTATGFQKFTATKVVLDVAQKLRVDVALTVGVVTEEITVTGESVAQVETQSSEIGATITGKQIDQLMLNGRNFTQLVNLAPGVVNQTGQDEGTVGVYGNVAYSMNGGRTEYNNWELDGGDNMDNGSNATLNVYPNVEAIAEFKVLTSNYGAQYGRNGSGTVEVETKSGTNSFHGAAFEYLRNDVFNAKSWDEGADPTARKAPYKKHDFGYVIGGPVFIPGHYNTDKKKTFFFWSEEWRREKNPSTILQNVPSNLERTGDFSDLCPNPNPPGGVGGGPFSDCPTDPRTGAKFDGSKGPIPIDPTAQALLALIPTPNNTLGGFPAVLQTVSTPTQWREELIRIDHNLTDNYRLTFRYIHDSWQTVVPNPLWGVGSSNFQDIHTQFVGPGSSFVARLNANISPTLLNEFVASYTADHIFLTAIGPSTETTLPGGFAMGSIFNNSFGGKLPSISLASNLAYGGSLAQDTGYFPWNNANPVYTYRDNMTKVHGTHTFQFGAYIAFAQKNEQSSANLQGILTFDSSNSTIPSTGNAFADLLVGNIAQYQQWNLEPKYYNRYRLVEPYFQDDWRITKRLTLNLGVRLSLFGTYRERYKHAFNFDPNAFIQGNSPTIDVDGSVTGFAGSFVPGTGNPFNGIVQCGGSGGTFPVAGFPNASAGSNSNPGCLKGHLFNPAPRIGFAFDPKGNGKMAIRGGYGIFYEHTNGNEGNTESLEGSAPFALNASQFNISGYGNIGGGGESVPFFPLGVTSIPNKAVWPYVQQWNLSVQKELPAHFVVSVAYVGSKGTHLTSLSNINQLLPVPASANPYTAGEPIIVQDPINPSAPFNTVCPDSNTLLGGSVNGQPVSGQVAVNLGVACGADPNTLRTAFPGFGNIARLQDTANSIYHSLQTTAQRTVGALTLSVAYTYSHSIDDSSDRFDSAFVNSYNVAANRGNSSFDMRHNLAISYVYSLASFHTNGLTRTVLGGWQVSGITIAQSGTPFSVTNGTSFGDNAGVANGTGTGSRPDLVADPRSGVTQDSTRGRVLYNPAAFAIPTGLTFGTIGRNTLYYPGRLNFDFGIFKKFAINEKTGFDFRWEIFNLFNHTQFNAISSDLGSSDFMHLNGTHAPRRMQVGLRFYF
jgi:hypothetical protein